MLPNNFKNHIDDLQAPRGVTELATLMKTSELLDIMSSRRCFISSTTEKDNICSKERGNIVPQLRIW